MPYVPINIQAYVSAYAGALAGMAVNGWIVDPVSGRYSEVAAIAGAFSEAFDQVWNNAVALNNLEASSIQTVCQNEFAGRGPGSLDNPNFVLRATWAIPATACAALVLEGDVYFASQGINPGTQVTSSLVSIDGSDTTSGFLASKLVVGAGLSLTVLNPGGAEQLRINLLTPFAITAFGLTGPTLVLAGTSVVNPAFTAAYNQLATSVTLTDTEGNNDVIPLPGTAFVSPHTVTKTAYGASVSFTNTAVGPTGTGSGTAGASITWGQDVYFGSIVDPGVYNNAFITGLAAILKLAPAGTYTYNASALQSCFFCCRSAFGLTPANFTVGGFPFACSMVATGVAVTNTNGVVENYDVFRSDNIGLGAFNLVEA